MSDKAAYFLGACIVAASLIMTRSITSGVEGVVSLIQLFNSHTMVASSDKTTYVRNNLTGEITFVHPKGTWQLPPFSANELGRP